MTCQSEALRWSVVSFDSVKTVSAVDSPNKSPARTDNGMTLKGRNLLSVRDWVKLNPSLGANCSQIFLYQSIASIPYYGLHGY
jgi:hypothetical protein